MASTHFVVFMLRHTVWLVSDFLILPRIRIWISRGQGLQYIHLASSYEAHLFTLLYSSRRLTNSEIKPVWQINSPNDVIKTGRMPLKVNLSINLLRPSLCYPGIKSIRRYFFTS